MLEQEEADVLSADDLRRLEEVREKERAKPTRRASRSQRRLRSQGVSIVGRGESSTRARTSRTRSRTRTRTRQVSSTARKVSNVSAPKTMAADHADEIAAMEALFAMQTKYDFTGFGPYLFALLLVEINFFSKDLIAF